MVHILSAGQPLCGFTRDEPQYWPITDKWVGEDEAHYATCQRCISELHDHDELEALGCHVTPEHPWPR